jgi:hypothetical protein
MPIRRSPAKLRVNAVRAAAAAAAAAAGPARVVHRKPNLSRQPEHRPNYTAAGYARLREIPPSAEVWRRGVLPTAQSSVGIAVV